MRKASIALTLFVASPMAFAAGPPILPDPLRTPGDALITDAKLICASDYSKTVHQIPASLKNKIYRSYDIFKPKPGEFEIDQLISFELGGPTSAKNLWPQSRVAQPWNDQRKDQLENTLHQMVCSGRLPIRQAQQDIAADWTKAYEKYLGPHPGATLSPEKASTSDEPPGFSPHHGQKTPERLASLAADEPGKAATLPSYPPVQPDESGSCPPTAPVKGAKNGTYYVPGDPHYDHNPAKHCFSTPEAAQAEGFHGSKGRARFHQRQGKTEETPRNL